MSVTNSALAPDPLRPPRGRGLGRSLGLAALVHLLLIVLLSLGVNWHSHTPPAVDAELWSASPQFAAAAAALPPPAAPQPAARPVAAAAPTGPSEAEIALARQRAAAKAQRDAELKLQQQAAKQKLARHKLEQQKLAQQKLQQQKLEQKQLAQQKQAAAAAQKLAQQKLEQRKLAQQQAKLQQQARDQQLKSMLAQAGHGSAGASGNAQQNSGPSGGYGARLATLIKQNTIYPQLDQIDGDPKVTLLVTLDPNTGEVLGARITQSSGVPSWDQAAQRALLRIGHFPADHGHWWTPMEITAGPRDSR